MAENVSANVFELKRSFSTRKELETEIGPAEWTGQRAASILRGDDF